MFNKQLLKDVQYKNSLNLDARKSLHELYSTNPASLWEWAGKKYEFKANHIS